MFGLGNTGFVSTKLLGNETRYLNRLNEKATCKTDCKLSLPHQLSIPSSLEHEGMVTSLDDRYNFWRLLNGLSFGIMLGYSLVT